MLKGLGRKYCERHCYELVVIHNWSQFLSCVYNYWWRLQQILPDPKLNRGISPGLQYPENGSVRVRIRFGCELYKISKWQWLEYDSLFLSCLEVQRVGWGLGCAPQRQDPVFFYLIAPPSSALGFHLMFQNGCLRSSRHVCILDSREEKGTKKGIPSPFRNIFWKLHILLLLISHELELNHMLHLTARGIGKRIFIWSGHVSNLKLWDSVIKGGGKWMLKDDS